MMRSVAEYEQFDAIGLSTPIARGESTASKVLAEAITRAKKLNPAINAIIMALYDRARALARVPLPEGPFAGVPFLLKAALCVDGRLANHGIRQAVHWLSRRPRQHAPCPVGLESSSPNLPARASAYLW
jgi:Asp-tRNA(Asn)/Glu-tRNA(Gln) amidotransferase A subunit family amidase